jgi:enterochelin esterase-like enzyme
MTSETHRPRPAFHRGRQLRRSGPTALCLGLVAGLAMTAPAVAAGKPDRSAGTQSSRLGAGNGFSPQVKHTGTGPTGYQVTFRYRDPSATRVQIKGEWYFSDPARTSVTTSQGVLPGQWKPGDIPIAYPNDTAANWPVVDMTKDGKTGVWTSTTPLPSGIFTYGFFVDCASADGAGCTEVHDPHNAPFNSRGSTTVGTVEPTSQVYVPSDPRFGTADYSWEAPAARHGGFQDLSDRSPESTTPAGTHPLAVYTPPGYDPRRPGAYPTLYLTHGGAGSELDWPSQGAEGNILDNLIDEHVVQPMVVVSTDEYGFNGNTAAFDPDAYVRDLLGDVLPYVQQHFNVSHSPGDRALAGLPVTGGSLVNTVLFGNTGAFASYGVMSPAGGFPTTLTDSQLAALRKTAAIRVGGGLFEPKTHRPEQAAEDQLLTDNGVPFADESVPGGHEWFTWRQLIHDYLANVIFKTTRTTLAPHTARNSVTLTATVKATTREPAAPGGYVRFSVDGVAFGAPTPLRHGRATLKVPTGLLPAGKHAFAAAYSGDNYYTASKTAS